MRQSQWLKVAALGTWAVCGLPSIVAIAQAPSFGSTATWWMAAYVAYGVALVVGWWCRAAAPRVATALIAVQSVTAVIVTDLTGLYLDRTGVGLLVGVGLMVIVAAALPHVWSAVGTGLWIAGQTLAMALLLARGLGLADVITFGLGAAGFQMFASMTTALMLREASARAEVARTNAELHATRALLAENSRAGERLRIARDLHDTLGHHLTALSLQLDVASRLADGKAAAQISQAHALTRLLLAEVRSVVGEMRAGSRTDLTQEIRRLAAASDAVDIHVDVPARLTVDDDAQAHSLLRCVQEIITNTSRHAHARNLWIRIEQAADGIELHVRDDGRGADAVQCGNGLNGMRERFAEYSGRIEFETRIGQGFQIHGFMPLRQVAS